MNWWKRVSYTNWNARNWKLSHLILSRFSSSTQRWKISTTSVKCNRLIMSWFGCQLSASLYPNFWHHQISFSCCSSTNSWQTAGSRVWRKRLLQWKRWGVQNQQLLLERLGPWDLSKKIMSVIAKVRPNHRPLDFQSHILGQDCLFGMYTAHLHVTYKQVFGRTIYYKKCD